MMAQNSSSVFVLFGSWLGAKSREMDSGSVVGIGWIFLLDVFMLYLLVAFSR